MTLFWQQFRTRLNGLLIWSGISLMLVMAVVQKAAPFVTEDGITNLLKSLPPAFQSMIGIPEGLSPVDGYVAVNIEKSFIIVAALYAVFLALSIVTREVDRRTIDFVLALPVQRRDLLLSRAGVMAVNSALQLAAMWIGLALGLASQGLTGSLGGYALIMLNLWLLSVALGGLVLLCSLWVDDYSYAVKLFLGLVLGAWILEFMLRAAQVSRFGRAFNPFSYINPTAVLQQGSIAWTDAAVLVAIAAIGIGISVPIFTRKQITT